MKKRTFLLKAVCAGVFCAAIFSMASCATTGGNSQDSLPGKVVAAIDQEAAKKGAKILEVELTAPEDQKRRDYLGIEKGQSFTVADIDADLVLVEIFSMYCPHCQREAPEVNKLYEKMKGAKRARGRVKIIGIGVGNSAYEVELFRQSYKIEFPLFPDERFVAHKRLGSVRTPTFIGVKNHAGGKSEVVFYRVGALGDAGGFLEELLDKSGF